MQGLFCTWAGENTRQNPYYLGKYGAKIHVFEAYMFGLFRTAIIISVAFVSGLVFERSQASEACSKAGGEQREGICRGVR